MFTESNYIMWYDTVWGFRNTDIKEKLYDFFGSAEEIWRADEKTLKSVGFLSDNTVSKLVEGKKKTDIAYLVNLLYLKNIKYYSRLDDDFPEKLYDLPYDVPMGIYVRGEIPQNRHFVSIVGSRKCSEYGALCCRKFAKELAQNGVCVISGMAVGTDSIAHRASLDGGGSTVAVLGTGADICYPALNEELMGRILSKGCVMSEFALGTPPLPYNFPYRNRLISALSDAVVIIEAAEKSGTLITADYAVEQSRMLFALPGNITSRLSKGTNDLIKSGVAIPVTESSDVLKSLGINNKISQKNKKITENLANTLATNEKMVYDCIDSQPINVDEISSKTGVDIKGVQYILTVLELKGLVERMPGQKFVRTT